MSQKSGRGEAAATVRRRLAVAQLKALVRELEFLRVEVVDKVFTPSVLLLRPPPSSLLAPVIRLPALTPASVPRHCKTTQEDVPR